MPLCVPLSSSEILHTRVTPGMGREHETLDPFAKWPTFFFLMELTNTLFSLLDFFCWFEEMPLLAAENGYDQVSIGLKIPAFLTSSKMVTSQHESFALQIKTFLWKACLCKVFSDLFFFGKYACRCVFCFDGNSFEVSNVMQTLSLF